MGACSRLTEFPDYLKDLLPHFFIQYTHPSPYVEVPSVHISPLLISSVGKTYLDGAEQRIELGPSWQQTDALPLSYAAPWLKFILSQNSKTTENV